MEPVLPGEVLVEDCPQEDVLSRIRIRPVRILVPIDLQEESALAAVLRYASSVAIRFGSELVLFYAFDDPEGRNASRAEKQVWRCLAAVRTRHPTARLFVRAGIVGDQVKAVAASVGAGLIVMSRDYYHRFLSWLAREEAGLLAIQGMPCPVALVDTPDTTDDGLAVEASVASAFGSVPGTSIVRKDQPSEQPPPTVRHAVWSLSARSRSRDARARLNRGRLRGRHCFAHGG